MVLTREGPNIYNIYFTYTHVEGNKGSKIAAGLLKHMVYKDYLRIHIQLSVNA